MARLKDSRPRQGKKNETCYEALRSFLLATISHLEGCDGAEARPDRRAHIYREAVSMVQVHRKYVKHLFARVFDNSAGKILAQALVARPFSPEELAQIRLMLDEMVAK